MQKSVNAFLLLLFRRTGILLKFAQNRLEIPLCDKDATLPRRSLHIGSQVQTRGVSALCEVDRGMIQQAGGSGCTPTACVRFLWHRSPAGLREPILWLQRGHFCVARQSDLKMYQNTVLLRSTHPRQ